MLENNICLFHKGQLSADVLFIGIREDQITEDLTVTSAESGHSILNHFNNFFIQDIQRQNILLEQKLELKSFMFFLLNAILLTMT